MATTKRRLITSIHNLTPEQLAELKALYPLGFNDVMMRYDKPDGTFFYTVPYETEDTYYMVKIDVKIDDAVDDDNDGYYDDDEIKGADELADTQSDEMSDEDYQSCDIKAFRATHKRSPILGNDAKSGAFAA